MLNNLCGKASAEQKVSGLSATTSWYVNIVPRLADLGVLKVIERSRGRAVTPPPPAGEVKVEGWGLVMRMIWSFRGETGSQSECLSSCQANARVNKQPFPPGWHGGKEGRAGG